MSGVSLPAADLPAQPHGRRKRPWLALPLRLHILGIVFAALLPVTLAGGLWLRGEVLGLRDAFRAKLMEHARNLCLLVEAEIGARVAVAIALSNASGLEPAGDRGALERELRTAAEQLRTWLFIFGPPPGLAPLLSTLAPPGDASAMGPARSEPQDAVPQLFASGVAQITPVHRRPIQEAWVASALAPMRRDGEVVAALGVGIDLEQLGELLGRPPAQPGLWSALIDGAGTIAARSSDMARRVGQKVPPWFAAATAGRDSGFVQGETLEGVPQIYAFVRLARAPGWMVVVGAPAAMDRAAWQRPLPALAAALMVALAIGAGLALLLAQRCLRTVAGLTDRAAAVLDGRALPPTPPDSGVLEFETLCLSLDAATHSLLDAAAAAQRQHELLQAVIESTPNPVVVKGLDGRVQLANAAAGEAYGRPSPALLGEVATALLSPDCSAREVAHDLAVLQAGASLTEEHPIPGLGNRIFRITKTLLRSRDGGAVRGIVTLMQDTTEQRRSEAELRTAEAEMQHLGRRATVGVMASGLAHELNQPLTAATNYLRAAGRLLEREDALRPERLPVLREAVSAAAAQSLRAGEIVRRLREFLGKRVSAPVLEPVGAVVEEGVRLALSGLTPPDLELKVLLPPSLGSALLDRVPVQQVLVNLVRNAVEAMRGRTRQVLTVAARRIWVERQAWIEISVSDTGPGLPPEVAARLFEPFVGTKPDGLGVGLAICRRFAESQGGRIEAARNAEGGMVFTLTLPTGAAEEPAEPDCLVAHDPGP